MEDDCNNIFKQHWRSVTRIRCDPDLDRRKAVVRRHLRKFYNGSPVFLERLSNILEDAVLVKTDLARNENLDALREQAKNELAKFLQEQRTINNPVLQPEHSLQPVELEQSASSEESERRDHCHQREQHEQQDEEAVQHNSGEPSCHSSLMNVSSAAEEYRQCRKRKAQCLDHAVSDLLLKAALGQTIFSNSTDSVGATKLRHVLDLMRVGRFRRAIEDIIGCWDLDDCQVIVQHGVDIFQQQKIDDNSGYVSFAKHIGHLTQEGMHERFIDPEKQADLMKNLILPDKAAPKCYISLLPLPDPDQLLEALYDPVFINHWFYWMNSPYMVTSKLIVDRNIDEHNRAGHLAYLICYWNSYGTRKWMGKLDADDVPDSSKIPVAFDLDNGPWHRRRRLIGNTAQDRPRPEKKPVSFRQTNSGQCCTLALFNFLANQEPCSQSEIVKTILSRTCSDVSEVSTIVLCSRQYSTLRGYVRLLHDFWKAEYDPYAADRDDSLRRLHHWLLSDRDTDLLQEEQSLDDLDVYESPQPSGNHMIVIMPFAGYVWEIDSYHSYSPLCLGAIGDDWKHVAQERLQLWSEAARESRVNNDVHAIIQE